MHAHHVGQRGPSLCQRLLDVPDCLFCLRHHVVVDGHRRVVEAGGAGHEHQSPATTARE
jgi:hypothetical protein